MAMGGVGEAMLLGAAMGGGSAALTGGDPLKGALLGGVTGGIGGAVSPALSAMTGGVNPATLAPAVEAGGAAAASTAGAAGTAGTAGSAGIPSLLGENAAQNIASAPNLYPSGFGSPNTATLLTPSGTSYAIPSATSNVIPPTGVPQTFGEGMAKFAGNPLASIKGNMGISAASGLAGAIGGREEMKGPEEYDGPLKRFKFNPESYRSSFYAAEGGIADLAAGGYDRMVGEEPMYQAMAAGGIANLGSYSDGGRMLKGPGDGMSDSIPASISGKRPARLADGEFVVPADVVSHLGNGSTDAGAKQLYAMMNKVRQARTGRKAQGKQIDPRQYMAA